MKILISLVVSIALAVIVAAYMSRPRVAVQSPEPPALSELDLPEQPIQRPARVSPASDAALQAKPTPAVTADNTKSPGADPNPTHNLVFEQAMDTLCSPRTTFAQKQAAWGGLRNSGKLDDAIAELERRAAANPAAAEYPAALGQACLQKAGTLQDIREQGILGMKADQNFDAALNIDPDNWDARFWKATAMSYWPPQLGKGKDVIENCLELLRRQELLPPQPEFAQTYVLLGSEYLKQGQQEYALQAWKRGLGLFPEHPELREKASQAGE